jgi:hypothetical protein
VGNVIDFLSYKNERDRVQNEIQAEVIREDFMEFLMSPESYTPDTFTFTIDLSEDNDE